MSVSMALRSTDEIAGSRVAISSNKALMKCPESDGHATRRRPDKMSPPPDVHSSPSPWSLPVRSTVVSPGDSN